MYPVRQTSKQLKRANTQFARFFGFVGLTNRSPLAPLPDNNMQYAVKHEVKPEMQPEVKHEVKHEGHQEAKHEVKAEGRSATAPQSTQSSSSSSNIDYSSVTLRGLKRILAQRAATDEVVILHDAHGNAYIKVDPAALLAAQVSKLCLAFDLCCEFHALLVDRL